MASNKLITPGSHKAIRNLKEEFAAELGLDTGTDPGLDLDQLATKHLLEKGKNP